MRPCATCSHTQVKSGIYRAILQDFVKRNLPKTPRPYSKRRGTHKVEMKGLKPNATIFYFGTMSRDFRKPIQMRDRAYATLKNSGVTKSDAKGRATFYVKCPQIYKEPKQNKVYVRHFHFLYYKAKEERWSSKLYTHSILCDIKQDEVKRLAKSRKVKVVDALPEAYFNKEHIKGAVNIPHNKRMKRSTVEKLLGKNRNVPIIVYCYSAKCNAAEKVAHALDKLGYHNTLHYVDGISKWKGKKEGKKE